MKVQKDQGWGFQVVGIWGVAIACLGGLSVQTMAEDWPTFRHDNARSGISAEAIAPPLNLQWVFVPPHAPEPAWPEGNEEKPRVRFDEVYHVVAAEDAVYFGSSADGKVYCLDAATGQTRWTFFTGGPVRVAPAVVNGRVYVGSDDGFAYCLNAGDGTEIWKVRAAHRDDKVIGNGKMISLWPIRTGVLVDNDVAYFGAGVFPHESLFVCAVNAETGAVLWRNDTVGEEGYKQIDFGGISPQGPLLASANTLFVPSGRAMPAAFSRADGKLLYCMTPGGKIGGTYTFLAEDTLVAGTEGKRVYEQERGTRNTNAAYAWFPGLQLVVTSDKAYMTTWDEAAALDRSRFSAAEEAHAQVEEKIRDVTNQIKALDAKKKGASDAEKAGIDEQQKTLAKQNDDLAAQKKSIEDGVYGWRRPTDLHESLILAGDCLYLGGAGRVEAARADTGEATWSAPIEGRACGLTAANGRLWASTDKGAIYCFGSGSGTGSKIAATPDPSPYPDDDLTALCRQTADRILAESGVTKGYCLVYGCGTGRLAYELAKRTELRIVGIDPDPRNVEIARKALDSAGLYGVRVLVDQGDLSELPYADYFANLVVSETMLATGKPEGSPNEVMRVLKPHGGVVCLGCPGGPEKAFSDSLVADANATGELSASLPGGDGRWIKVVRGALPGEGEWTHQYAEPGNTACSDDVRVKGPLGTLWFGDPGPKPMVERHARPAAPLAMDGRLFVQGANVLMAYDSYNGTKLWEKPVTGAVRVRVDSDMSNLALAGNGLYAVTDTECLRFDPATGDLVRKYPLPKRDDGQAGRWGYLACTGDTLFGSISTPLHEPYGNIWHEIADEEKGVWRDIDKAAEKRGLDKTEQAVAARFKTEFAKPDARAFWAAHYSGALWHTMADWPAWGSVESPVGAVTERIMSGDTFFAIDTETGDLRWKYTGKAIAHPAIAIGNGTVFLADCSVTEEQKKAAMQERQDLIAKGVWEKEGIEYGPSDADVRLVVAFDAITGAEKWRRIIDLTGCGGDRMGLAYSDGVLCFFGCFSNHDRNLFRSGKLKWRRITAVSGNDGHDLWSRPLNYLRRPVIVGDTILIEPRACDLHTGAIKTRRHPLTDAEVPWEFVRPGHCCSITSACPSMFFLRGNFLWYYDLAQDSGMLPYGAIRPGCWINTIPANGLVLFPEASSGCTCSYPVRSTVVLQPKKELRTWGTFVQHAPLLPVKHMAVSLGAPGDYRAPDGTLWLGYPHPPSTDWHEYGLNFPLGEEFFGEKTFFRRGLQGIDIKNTDKPWLFASGAQGLKKLSLPLLEPGQGPARYTVRLYFYEPGEAAAGERVFSIALQDKTVLKRFDICAEAGGPNTAVVKEFGGIKVDTVLSISLEPRKEHPQPDEQPVLNAIEVIREDTKLAQAF